MKDKTLKAASQVKIEAREATKSSRQAALEQDMQERRADLEQYILRAKQEFVPAPDEHIPEEQYVVIAENRMMTDGLIPPSMTGWLRCDRCGVMPGDAGMKGDKVVGCPWCSTIWGKKFTEQLKQYERAFGLVEDVLTANNPGRAT